MKHLVVKETEKAVAIENLVYLQARESALRDVKEVSRDEYELLQSGQSLIWLPKSQVKVEDGYVVDMPEWLAKKNGLCTDKMIEEARARYQAGCDRYNRVLSFAKEHGLAVRNKMKLANILAEIKKAGLDFQG